MNKVVSILLAVLILGGTNSKANDRNIVSAWVQESFKKEFPGVDSVTWKKEGEFSVATFNSDHHCIMAFFDDEGQLLGHARYILFEELPMVVAETFQKSYSDADTYEIREVVNPEGTFYWATVELTDRKYRIKISADGKIIHKARQ